MNPSRQLILRLKHYLRFQPVEQTSIGEIVDLHGSSSNHGLLLLSSLLSMIPLIGLGNILSVLILNIAWTHTGTNPTSTVTIPKRVASLKVKQSTSRQVVTWLSWVYRYANVYLRPRAHWFVAPSLSTLWSSWITLMVTLMFLPLPLVNMLPSVAILFISLGWIFKDGLMMVCSLVAGLGAFAYVAACWSMIVKAVSTWF
jgi:hypothetical protein